LLERAASTIRIIDHRVRDWQITKLLQQREASGVKVQILGQGDLAGMISHGKLMLIDGCTAVLGSTSLMRSSLNERREVAVVLEDPDLVARLNRHFEDLANIAPAAVQSAPKGEVADDTAEEDPGDDI
jgi:phosphatidylserine/phosphatidylglycerophosphate/cardiolipin synthase-like enzyme